MSNEPALRAESLGRRYGRRTWALRDCTLELPRGRIIGHPDSSFWVFQAIESAAFLALAAVFLARCHLDGSPPHDRMRSWALPTDVRSPVVRQHPAGSSGVEDAVDVEQPDRAAHCASPSGAAVP